MHAPEFVEPSGAAHGGARPRQLVGKQIVEAARARNKRERRPARCAVEAEREMRARHGHTSKSGISTARPGGAPTCNGWWAGWIPARVKRRAIQADHTAPARVAPRALPTRRERCECGRPADAAPPGARPVRPNRRNANSAEGDGGRPNWHQGRRGDGGALSQWQSGHGHRHGATKRAAGMARKPAKGKGKADWCGASRRTTRAASGMSRRQDGATSGQFGRQ